MSQKCRPNVAPEKAASTTTFSRVCLDVAEVADVTYLKSAGKPAEIDGAEVNVMLSGLLAVLYLAATYTSSSKCFSRSPNMVLVA